MEPENENVSMKFIKALRKSTHENEYVLNFQEFFPTQVAVSTLGDEEFHFQFGTIIFRGIILIL
jgi:hypothetical protein